MHGEGAAVLYVGKAKNLRKRLGSYRVANPERMPRRHLRLLRLVVRIELQECADEAAALAREAELLRTLKPRFNRAGTWPGPPRFLAWRTGTDAIEFTITEAPEAGWNHGGPMGSGAFSLCARLARLLWLAMNRTENVGRLPEGWAVRRIVTPLVVPRIGDDSAVVHEAGSRLASLFAGDVESFCQWIEARRAPLGSPFERAWLESEFESMREWFKPSSKRVAPTTT